MNTLWQRNYYEAPKQLALCYGPSQDLCHVLSWPRHDDCGFEKVASLCVLILRHYSRQHLRRPGTESVTQVPSTAPQPQSNIHLLVSTQNLPNRLEASLEHEAESRERDLKSPHVACKLSDVYTKEHITDPLLLLRHSADAPDSSQTLSSAHSVA